MHNFPDTSRLDLSLDDGWLTIALDNPANRNAIDDAMIADFLVILNAIRDNRAVRGITLRGKNGIFCSGGDLKGFNAMTTAGVRHADVARQNRAMGEVLIALNETPQVVVALIEGAAIAGGLGLMCCADVIISTPNAKFSLTETMIGIPPAQIAPYVVARVGLPMARRIMLTGARFTGQDALAYNLVDILSDDLDADEARIRRGVLKCAPGAIAATKRILLSSRDVQGEAMMDLAANIFADCLLSDEGVEGISSFVEKRKPKWQKT